MSAPCWRVWVGPNGAVTYGNDDGGRGTEEYGTERAVRRIADYFKRQGDYTRLECRGADGDPWEVVSESKATNQLAKKAMTQQSLFGE